MPNPTSEECTPRRSASEGCNDRHVSFCVESRQYLAGNASEAVSSSGKRTKLHHTSPAARGVSGKLSPEQEGSAEAAAKRPKGGEKVIAPVTALLHVPLADRKVEVSMAPGTLKELCWDVFARPWSVTRLQQEFGAREGACTCVPGGQRVRSA